MPKKPNKVVIQEAPVNASDNGIREYSLTAIADMPLPLYYQKAGRILNARNQVYRDVAIFQPGTVTPSHKARLFTKGIGQQDKVINSPATVYEKGRYHTNMIADGEFEGGTTFLMSAIEARVFISNIVPRNVTLGQIVDTATNATQNASVLHDGVTRQFELTFVRTEQSMHNGLLYEFPTRFCSSGVMGNVADGFVQNGPFAMDSWNKLSSVQVLESDDKFHFDLQPLADTMELPSWVVVEVLLVGKRIGTLYAS